MDKLSISIIESVVSLDTVACCLFPLTAISDLDYVALYNKNAMQVKIIMRIIIIIIIGM